MRTRTRLIAIAATVLALLTPTALANADPVNPVAIVLDVPSVPTVYPVTDGYGDSVTISGELTAAASTRVRATVSVWIGTRVLKTWTLSTTGPFSFVWNGKAGTTIVPGSAVVRVRVSQDDGTTTTATRPLSISSKKVTAVTYTKTVQAGSVFSCDDSGFSGSLDEYFSHQQRICPMNYKPRSFDYLSMTISGRRAIGDVWAQGYLRLPTAVRHSLRTPVATVSAAFSQSGSGKNYFFVGMDPDSVHVKQFSSSGTWAVSGAFDAEYADDLTWSVIVDHGHNLTVVSYRVKITYYALR